MKKQVGAEMGQENLTGSERPKASSPSSHFSPVLVFLVGFSVVVVWGSPPPLFFSFVNRISQGSQTFL